jgi:ACS family hexuronate transporter-like MFS transporter
VTTRSSEPAPLTGAVRGWSLAGAATLTMAVSYVDRQTLAVLAVTVCASLSIDETHYGWLLSAFSLAYLVGAPIAGRLVDWFGARRVLLAAVLAWSAVAAAHSLASGFASLFALRLLLGLAEAPSFPGAAQTIHRALPPTERPRAFGILYTGSSLGAMLAPPVATALEARFGWRVAFCGTALVGLAWVPLWLTLTRSGEAKHLLDRREAPTSTAAGDPRRSALVTLLRHPAMHRQFLLVTGSAPLLGFLLGWGAKWLVRHQGLTQAEVGAYLWIPPVLFDVGSVVFGSLASRHAKATQFAPARGLVAAAGLLAATAALLPHCSTPLVFALVAGVAMAGGGGIYAISTADTLTRLPAELVSTASGLSAAAQSVLLIASSPLVGAVAARAGGYHEVAVALALWVVPFCAAWMATRAPPALTKA